MKIRIDKLISNLGIASRRDIKKLLKNQLLLVDGVRITTPETKVDTVIQTVELNGQKLIFKEKYYYLLNKPKGVVSATTDNLHSTVIDLLGLDSKVEMFPVGRLDIDTTGLLIITNDGDFAHRVTSPKSNIKKYYKAVLNRAIPDIELVQDIFRKGVDIMDHICEPASLSVLDASTYTYEVVITEGKFHQVKRMFQAVGYQVVDLCRTRIGSLTLGSLEVGMFRELEEAELEQVFE